MSTIAEKARSEAFHSVQTRINSAQRLMRWKRVGDGSGRLRSMYEARIDGVLCCIHVYVARASDPDQDPTLCEVFVGDDGPFVVRDPQYADARVDILVAAQRLAEAHAVAVAGGEYFIDRAIYHAIERSAEHG